MGKAAQTLRQVEHMNAQMAIMREHLASQGHTLEAIKGAVDGLAAEVHGVLLVVQNHERRLHDLETHR